MYNATQKLDRQANLNQLVSTHKMFKNDGVNPSHPRRGLQDQTGPPEQWFWKPSKGTKTLAQLHRQPGQSNFGIHAQQITDWERQVLDGIPTAFESTTSKPMLNIEQREQIENPLFQQIGQLKVEND